MENHSDNEKNSKDPKGLEKSSQRTIQSSELGERFQLDKSESPSADFRAKIEDVENVFQRTQGGFMPKRQAQRKADEVVRYMSKLPSYLERGEHHQEKAFNVGVLEWGRLEKWQHNQRQLFREGCMYSPSSSDSSTQGSSSDSIRGRTRTPGCLRTYHATTESNRRGSLSEVFPHGAKSSEKDVFMAHDPVTIPSNYVKVQQSILKTHQCFNKYTEMSSEESKLKHPHRRSILDRRPWESENQCATSDSKGKLKFQEGDIREEKEKLQVSKHNLTDQNRRSSQQTVALLQPKERQENRNPAAPEQANSTKKYSMGSLEPNRKILFDYSDSKERVPSEAGSSSVPYESDRIARTEIEQPSSNRTEETKFPFEVKWAIVNPRASSVSHVRCKIPEDKLNKALNDPVAGPTSKIGHEGAPVHLLLNSANGDPVEVPKFKIGCEAALVPPRGNSVSPVRCKTPEDKSNQALTEPAEEAKPKVGREVVNKTRNPSPISRFSLSMGKIVKSSSSTDLSSMGQSNQHTGKLGSQVSENPVSPPDTDKSNASRKASASPLRRLLDPFLKPRAGNSDQSTAVPDGNCTVSDRRGETHALKSVKVKLDLGSCKEIDVDQPHDIVKHGLIMVQALLKVALKNGLPLFTFAVDKSTEILAATMTRLSSSRKDASNWIFTFFTIHGMKKTGGSWLNHGSKDKTHGYIPNVVGQMKVSDVLNQNITGKNSADDSRIRQFVLHGINMRQADEKTSDLQANDELAAIVLKLPKMEGDRKKHLVQTVDSKDSSQKINSYLSRKDFKGAGSSSGSENLLGLTAILPGGEHGLPLKGRPSPLIERWRFGGSCDCGGWDLGCRVRVLTGEICANKRLSSDTLLSTKKIHLYSQEHALDRKPLVSLSPFKDGIYSVEFDSSLKLLQAFSLCIAILNGLKPVEFLEMSSFFQKKTSEEPHTWSNADGTKHPHENEGENPACFISCPPGTPADRV